MAVPTDRVGKVRYAVAILTVGVAGIIGTKTFEGPGPSPAPGVYAAYVDRLPTVPLVTVCYGHTETAKLGQLYTQAQCDKLLMSDLNKKYAPMVRRYVTVPLSQGEFNALVDFVYNVGEGNFRSSTMLRLINQQRYAEAAQQFDKWTFVGGKDCNIPANKCGGIPKRRAWQKAMFLS